MVLGISAGVGKSTFAKQLGNKLNIEVTHLDALFWKAGWVESSVEEFADAQKHIVQQERWIIEGNYSNTYHVREPYADTIIYLELPLRICLYRVFKRWWENRGKTRSDMAEGCEEKIDMKFLHFIITTYFPRKEKMQLRMKKFREDGKSVIQLKSRNEIRNFLNTL